MSEEYFYAKFKEKLVAFLDELIEQFPMEGDFIIMRIFVKDQLESKNMLNKFIRDILPLKDIIKNRKDSFFINHSIVKTPNNPQLFKKLWESDQLDQDDKEAIWKWVDLLICISDKYYNKYYKQVTVPSANNMR